MDGVQVPPADAVGLAQAREDFLRVESIEPQGVRQAILASWWRSRESKVAADRDPNLDTPLTRSAAPVLQHLREQLDGQPLSIVLTDPAGVVLSRLTADKALERHLDRVHLAPRLQLCGGGRRDERHRDRPRGRARDAGLRA